MMSSMELPVAPPANGAITMAPFESLYRERFNELARLAALISGDPSASFDIVQDAFVQLYRRWDRVDEPVAYLRRSVVNGCHSSRRKLGRNERATAKLAASTPLTTDLHAYELTDALATLPPNQRAALVLRHYLGLPDAEIAAILGCAPGTVASLVHRGLARLREVIPS